MDSYSAFDDATATVAAPDEDAAFERPPEIGVDERRMHVRAYNYWVSLLGGRPYPSIQDLDPQTIEDFGPNSVLLDFSRSEHDPEIAFLGGALRVECALDSGVRLISQVPGRSLLSRLTDHYLQIIANRAPIGFEAEFVDQSGRNMLYRGILMPLSSNGEAIDFIYGVINWKEMADGAVQQGLAGEVDRAIGAEASLSWADGPSAEAIAGAPGHEAEAWDDGDAAEDQIVLGDDAGLADRLCAAREGAEHALLSDKRSRAALYRALGLAYDFALATKADPEGYQELLDDEGLKVQGRAPMTPVVKLVFGVSYDKTRLTEFAAALSWASRERVPLGGLATRLDTFEGGLKGIVHAERAARRPAARPDPWQKVREELLSRPPLAQVNLDVDAAQGDFLVLLARRDAGGFAIVAPVADEKLTQQAIRKSAA